MSLADKRGKSRDGRGVLASVPPVSSAITSVEKKGFKGKKPPSPALPLLLTSQGEGERPLSVQMTSCARDKMGYVVGVNWQQVVSLMVVGVTAGIMLYRRFRPRKFAFAHATHCGCSSAGRSNPGNTVVFRARRGERPQILFKMK